MAQATKTTKTNRSSALERAEEIQPGTARQLADRVVEFDLPHMIDKLRADPTWKIEGHSAATIVKYPDLRIVLLALQAKAVMREHRADARISVQALTGHARLRLPDHVVHLPAGARRRARAGTPARRGGHRGERSLAHPLVASGT